MSLLERAYNIINKSPKMAQLMTISVIMVCRPTIMMLDKAVDPKTRRYAATREFFTELIGGSTVFAVGGLAEMLAGGGVKKAANTVVRKASRAHMIKTVASWAGTTLGVAVITPALNNKVINKDVLNFIEKLVTGKSGGGAAAVGHHAVSPMSSPMLNRATAPKPNTFQPHFGTTRAAGGMRV